MKTKIRRGQYKGKIYNVHQWCNDWFMLSDLPEDASSDVSSEIYDPTALMFDKEGMETIKMHKNNGILFKEYEAVKVEEDGFMYTFKRK